MTAPRARRLAALAAAALAAACGGADTARDGAPLAARTFDSLDGSAGIAVPGARGEVLVVNVWATWCEPCRREMPSLERLHRRLAGSGVRVVGISVDEDRFLAREFVRGAGITFRNGIGSARSLAAGELRVTRFPTTLAIDGRGVVRWREERARDWSSAESVARLEALAAAPAGR